MNESAKLNESQARNSMTQSGYNGNKRQQPEIPTGIIPITHDVIKERIMKIPFMQKVSPIIRKYLVEMPHAYLERYNENDVVQVEDPDFNMDFIYVLKGSI